MVKDINVFLNNELVFIRKNNHPFSLQYPFPINPIEVGDYKNFRIVIKSGKRLTMHFDGDISIW